MFSYEPLRNIIKDNGDYLRALQRDLNLSGSFINLFTDDLTLCSSDIAKLSCYYGVPAREFVEYDYDVLPCYNPVIVKLNDVEDPEVSYEPFRNMFKDWCKDKGVFPSVYKFLSNMEDTPVYIDMVYKLKNDKNIRMNLIHGICKFLRCHLDYVVDYK